MGTTDFRGSEVGAKARNENVDSALDADEHRWKLASRPHSRRNHQHGSALVLVVWWGGVFPFGNRMVAHQDHSWWATIVGWCVGGVLLSHTPPGAVPSALGSLASGFGMGPGGPSPLSPPTTLSPHTPTRGWGSLLVVL